MQTGLKGASTRNAGRNSVWRPPMVPKLPVSDVLDDFITVRTSAHRYFMRRVPKPNVSDVPEDFLTDPISPHIGTMRAV
jgi:hypothetical protein